ncbi:hypothetical protein [Skermanella pratensis]|uniref:hypothetical protein n=1 Tax=Skermanella pratensis TaxID=2233999 RepID=UPI0013015D1D|nr:hypothetical protein [Skermanella pratensis]
MTLPSNSIRGSIPEKTVRISVCFGDRLFVLDLPSDSIAQVLVDFEEFVGPALPLRRARGKWFAANGVSAVANFAAQDGDSHTVSAAVLWLFLFQPGAAERDRTDARLADMIERDGGAWLVATTDSVGVEWTFSLYSAKSSLRGGAGNPPIHAIRKSAEITLH